MPRDPERESIRLACLVTVLFLCGASVTRWSALPEMRVPRHGCAGALLDGEVYVIGVSEWRGERWCQHTLVIISITV